MSFSFHKLLFAFCQDLENIIVKSNQKRSHICQWKLLYNIHFPSFRLSASIFIYLFLLYIFVYYFRLFSFYFHFLIQLFNPNPHPFLLQTSIDFLMTLLILRRNWRQLPNSFSLHLLRDLAQNLQDTEVACIRLPRNLIGLSITVLLLSGVTAVNLASSATCSIIILLSK